MTEETGPGAPACPASNAGPRDLVSRLGDVRRRIEASGGDVDAVRIVAVTKGFGPQAMVDAVTAGLRDVGENYAQELTAKLAVAREQLPRSADLRVHFLGAVQRNKVRSLAPVVDCWHGVARAVEGEEIARRRPGAHVLVEVRAADVAGRGGCATGEVPGLVRSLSEMDLAVRGLMVMAPRAPEDARRAFRAVRELADGLGLEERSMGMTDDFEVAVAEGSTMVRIGRALFGDRPAGPPSESWRHYDVSRKA